MVTNKLRHPSYFAAKQITLKCEPGVQDPTGENKQYKKISFNVVKNIVVISVPLGMKLYSNNDLFK